MNNTNLVISAIKNGLSIGDLITFVGIIAGIVLYFIGKRYKSKCSKRYNIDETYFAFELSNDEKNYMLILAILSTLIIYFMVSCFYYSTCIKALFLLVLLCYIAHVLSNSFIRTINKNYHNYSIFNKCKLFRPIFIVIVFILNLLMFVFISTLLFFDSVGYDINEYSEKKSENIELIKIDVAEKNKENSEKYHLILNKIADPRIYTKNIAYFDKIRYFLNPKEFIRSDYVGIEDKQMIEEFFNYLKAEKFDNHIYNMIKLMFLLKMYNQFSMFLTVCSMFLILYILRTIIEYRINPYVKKIYDVINIEGESLMVLNEYNNAFLCVPYKMDENDNNIVVLYNKDYRVYSPLSYRFEEIMIDRIELASK